MIRKRIILFSTISLLSFTLKNSLSDLFFGIPVTGKHSKILNFIKANKKIFTITHDEKLVYAVINEKNSENNTDSITLSIRKYKMSYYKETSYDSITEITINYNYHDTILSNRCFIELEKELDALYKNKSEFGVINPDHLNKTSRLGFKYFIGQGSSNFVSILDGERFSKKKVITITYNGTYHYK